ncbi:hypothetical protein KBI52_18670 [Microvirga sp. HBU67558]|uniref:hypothetical protein n=1 Tax=Microvirga TaxID=186650 RepID=UPI001B37F7E8|nr:MULTISPECIES: hypothetical protein [unclassified Microvirga]MBQ0822218.1 hypothetical protein [Microvirga sp. HBU67558]
MPEARISVRVADNRQSVTVEMGPVEGLSARITLGLEQLTQVISSLGQARTQMVDGQRVEPLEGTKVQTIANPKWYIQVAPIDGSLLAFSHPAFGPIAFAIPREEVAQIVGVLTSHLSLPVCRQEKPN